MKVRMIADCNGRPVGMLECPESVSVKAVWDQWSPLWDELYNDGLSAASLSFAGEHKRMAFVEHLLWHCGCKHIDFEEFRA